MWTKEKPSKGNTMYWFYGKPTQSMDIRLYHCVTSDNINQYNSGVWREGNYFGLRGMVGYWQENLPPSISDDKELNNV